MTATNSSGKICGLDESRTAAKSSPRCVRIKPTELTRFRKEIQRDTGASQGKLKLLEMEETKEKALMLADLIASREVLLLLTVDEATEELRGLLNKLDAETQKEIMERACGFGPIT
jgi:hypothetical protein